jgi:hypothetical protein
LVEDGVGVVEVAGVVVIGGIGGVVVVVVGGVVIVLAAKLAVINILTVTLLSVLGLAVDPSLQKVPRILWNRGNHELLEGKISKCRLIHLVIGLITQYYSLLQPPE